MQLPTKRAAQITKSMVCGALAVIVISMLCKTAAASLLPLPPEEDDWSDIAVSLSGGAYGGSYNATSDLFSASGYATSFDVGPGTAADYAMFAPTTVSGLVIDEFGSVTTPGTLSVSLLSGVGPYPAGALLTGSVTDVLFVGVTDKVLEMQFSVTGGSAAADFGGAGAKGGMILNMAAAVPGHFGSSFSFTGTMDVLGPVPEPSSIILGGCGAIGTLLLVLRRRSRTSK
jgi:hypothetical protein